MSYQSFIPALGGVKEETLELIRRPLQSDEYREQMLLTQTRTIQLLEILLEQQGALLPEQQGRVGGDQDAETPGGTVGTTTPSHPTYWSSGDVTVASTEFESRRWEFVADTLTLFFDGDLIISFNPEADHDEIHLTADMSPATFSSVTGLHASEIHYRLPDGTDPATTQTTLSVVAFA